MVELDAGNSSSNIEYIKPGGLIVIQRKYDMQKILCSVKGIVNDNEILLSIKNNDYFNFDMYLKGESWVWRVWTLDYDINITSITNTTKEFPRR